MRKVKIEKVLPEVTRLTRLIEDLLTIDKLNAGKLILSKEPSGLLTLLQEVKDALELESASRGMTLSAAQDIVDCLLDCDAYQVKRVLINLCSNALKYSRGHANILLNAVQCDPNWMRIEVWDEGPGIPDTEKDLLFDPYQQGDGAMAKFGFGLGLSIAKTIVQEHGGTIAIRDRDDSKNGAIVFFTLPICAEVPEPEL
jgi:two-component system sensor histidine kinase KdpD